MAEQLLLRGPPFDERLAPAGAKGLLNTDDRSRETIGRTKSADRSISGNRISVNKCTPGRGGQLFDVVGIAWL